MHSPRIAAIAALAVRAVAATAQAAPKPGRTTPAMDRDRAPPQPATALVEAAKSQAEDGCRETTGIGRVLYLGGRTAGGEARFRALPDRTRKTSDVHRIAQVYAG